jgi:aconitate hydratase
MNNPDSLKSLKTLNVNGKEYDYYSLNTAAAALGADLSLMPYSLKILFENMLRNENGRSVTVEHIKAIVEWMKNKKSDQEISYYPARVLMQDFTGVPAVVDLAAMRDAMKQLGGDATKINPLTPVDLVIDHSVQVDNYGSGDSFAKNVDLEMHRNKERYEFLRWGQEAFDNFRVVPPGTGICHQVNLEYLAKVVWTASKNGRVVAYPDTLVGTDSHTTMINGLAVLGWGVGGIEAEAAMLGQGLSMLIPEIIGFKLTGKLKEGTTATDLVLTVTNMLRKKGVVNKFVEFYGEGLSNLSLADRATIANMAPEYGATCGFFPVDEETINYLKLSAREEDSISLVEAYAKAQGMWRDPSAPDPIFTDNLELALETVEPSLAGPKRPQDRVSLSNVRKSYHEALPSLMTSEKANGNDFNVDNKDYKLNNGNVAIAAITSCTNTSNPSVMIAAGLIARNALAKGLSKKPWVKTSLAPGSKVVTEYLEKSNLQSSLDNLGFNLVGYGCTTCIGNSGPLEKEIEDSINKNELVVAAVLSGNRNFEGRVHPLVKANYLASPPLVVAYALAGTVDIDLSKDPLGLDNDGNQIYLRDIWPSTKEIAEVVAKVVTPEMFRSKYKDVFSGDKHWQSIKVEKSLSYAWDKSSTYINNPPYFENMPRDGSGISDIKNAKILAILGDSITTDHISPAGNISKSSPAALYLKNNKVEPADFNSYGARRGNHEVMMRGTFANIRIKNELAPGTEGGVTTYLPTGEVLSIYDAAMKYKETSTSLIIIAGKEYGTGSSRDWAAKGTYLLGVKAVIAESFERIHRSNLVGMGVIPLVFKNGMSRRDLNLTGRESFDVIGIGGKITPFMDVELKIHQDDGSSRSIALLCRIDTEDEIEYINNGGILHSVVRKLLKS